MSTGVGTGLQAVGGVSGNYQLRVQMGKQDMVVTPESFTSIDIVEYIDRMLPSFTVTFKDPTGFLTNRLMIDKRYNTITFIFSNIASALKSKDMTFRIYRRFPESYTDIANDITFTGLLDVPYMFSPQFQRGWAAQPIITIVNQIASEMHIQNRDIESGLDNPVTVVQPNWSNAVMLQYLADRARSASGNVGFFVFVDTCASLADAKWVKSASRIVFRSLTSLLKQPAAHVLRPGKQQVEDGIIPIYNFEGTDNFEIMNILGVGEQMYTYFDYLTGMIKNNRITINEATFASLSKYFSYDKNIGTVGVSQNTIGRTTELSPEYTQLMRGRYYKRINSLVKQWVTIMGTTDIRVGEIVKIVQTNDPRNLMNQQYTGYWLVERVVHHITSTYVTKLLITRPGVDTQETTSLMRAPNIKR